MVDAIGDSKGGPRGDPKRDSKGCPKWDPKKTRKQSNKIVLQCKKYLVNCLAKYNKESD
jgi:hypothetical protein